MGEVGNCTPFIRRRICILITWNRYQKRVLEDMDLSEENDDARLRKK